MNAWLRVSATSGPTADPWHLLLGNSPHGMRVAHCGEAYPSDVDLDSRSFDDPPGIGDTCEACHVASRRVARFGVAAQQPMTSQTIPTSSERPLSRS
jgi:hypothetical protein